MARNRDLSKLLSTANGKIVGSNLDVSFENISDTGTEGTKVAAGTTAQRGSTTGQWRYNTTTGFFEGRNTSGTFSTLEPTPTVTSVDDTEVDSAGGGNQTIVVTGTNFSSGSVASFVGSSASFNASTTTVDSATQITAVAPKSSFLNAQEPYKVKVTSASGLAGTSSTGLINVDNAPTWTTNAGSLGSIIESATGNHFTVAASDAEGDTVAYSLQSGSLAGLSLNSSSGVISGDPTDVSSDTTNSFTLRATAGSKTTDRAFTYITQNNPIVQTNLVYDFRAVDFSGSAGTVSSGTNVGSCFGSRVNNAVFSTNSDTNYGNMTFTTNDSYAPSGKCFTLASDGAIQIQAGAVGGTSQEANYNTYFNSPSNVSWVMWVDWDASNTREGFYSRYGSSGDVDGNVAHFNHMFDNTTQFHFNQSGVNLAGDNQSESSAWQKTSSGSQWQLVIITYNSDGNQRWYVDGSQWSHKSNMGTNSGNGMSGYNNNQTPHTLGGRTDDVQMMTGKIAEARYYTKTLSSSEISAEWNATKGNYSRS